MRKLNVKTINESQTRLLGENIGSLLMPGTGVLLEGELGAGKTTIISGICGSLRVEEEVKSPTFVLAWVYRGICPIYHIDLYRLHQYEDLENIGWEEIAEESNIYLVEWADKFPLPYTENSIRIIMTLGNEPNERYITIEFDETLHPHWERALMTYVDIGN